MSTLQAPFRAYPGPDGYAFISYAHNDADLVYPIIMRLHDEGFRIWYDEGIPPGDGWAHTSILLRELDIDAAPDLRRAP